LPHGGTVTLFDNIPAPIRGESFAAWLCNCTTKLCKQQVMKENEEKKTGEERNLLRKRKNNLVALEGIRRSLDQRARYAALQ
jgi:DNA-directed RNA polymerase specialized sigma24 family protein